MLPNYQARSPFVLKHTPSWQASETVLGVDNAKSGICYMYVWMVHMPLKRARGCLLSPKNMAFRLDPSFF